MPRTTPEQVIDLGKMETGTDVIGYIETATTIVDDLEACSAGTEQRLELIERYLACHFASIAGVETGASIASKSIGGASTSYSRQASAEIDQTPYSKTAIALDASRCLYGILYGAASFTWLGKERT